MSHFHHHERGEKRKCHLEEHAASAFVGITFVIILGFSLFPLAGRGGEPASAGNAVHAED
jgi:hypothetical protein